MENIRSFRSILRLCINFLFYSPHVIIFYCHKNRSVLNTDMDHGFKLMRRNFKLRQPLELIYMLSSSRHFRNIFYFRTRPFSNIINWLYKEERTLKIGTQTIGEGFAVIHGIATIVGAASIGKNCVIYQQVTIGSNKYGSPKIVDNVTIYAGAVIIGKIIIGNNVTIGANSTVFKDVPDNSMVLPGSSKIMKWKNSNKLMN